MLTAMPAAEDRVTERLDVRLGSWLRRADLTLLAEKARVLEPFDLSVSQYAALYALSLGGLSGAQLARVCSVTPQSAATMLAGLQTRGLVSREPSQVHNAVLVATLTRAGRRLFVRADAAAAAVEARLSAAFSTTEDRQLRRLLARAIDTLEPN